MNRTVFHKTLPRKLQIEQHVPNQTQEVNSNAPKGYKLSWDSNFAGKFSVIVQLAIHDILIAHPSMFVVVYFQFIIHEGLKNTFVSCMLL
jgi:hypothetical protein